MRYATATALILVLLQACSSTPTTGDRPGEGRYDDGPLTGAQSAEPWAPLYLEYGGERSDYQNIFQISDCQELQRSFDGLYETHQYMSARGDTSVARWEISGLFKAVAWNGALRGCANFEGMGP